jgi:hypothetical protein
MTNTVSKIFIEASDKTQATFSAVDGRLKGLSIQSAATSNAFKSLFAGLSVAGFATFVKGAIDSADALLDLSTRTGLSVEALAGLQHAARLSDTNMEALSTGVGRLSKAIGEADAGNKTMAATLAKLGITAKDPELALEQLADAVAAMPDPTRRAAELSKLLGKSYQELLPLLNDGGAALRAMSAEGRALNPITSDLALQSAKFNDQLDALKTNASGAGTALALTLLPALNQVAEGFNNAARSKVSFLGGAALGVNIFNNAGQQIKDLREEIKALEKQQETAVSLGLGRYQSVDNKIAQAKELKKALEGVQHAEAMGVLDGVLKKGSQPPRDTSTPQPAPSKATPKLDELMTGPMKQLQAFENLKGRERLDEITDGLKALDVEMQGLAAPAEAFKQRLEGLISNTPIARTQQLQSDVDFLNQAFFDGKLGVAQYDQAISQITGKFEEANTKIAEQKSLAEELGLTFESAFENAIVAGGKLSTVLDAIYQDLLRIMVRKNITEPLGAMFSSVDWSGMFSSMTANAKGGVYAGPSISAYSGQIVSRPTYFANGGNVMGEAGPEVILPIARDAAGRMGVRGGAGNVQVIVNNNASGTQATARQRSDGNGGNIIEVVVEAVEGAIAVGIARGSGPVAAALAGTYGLNRAPGGF